LSIKTKKEAAEIFGLAGTLAKGAHLAKQETRQSKIGCIGGEGEVSIHGDVVGQIETASVGADAVLQVVMPVGPAQVVCPRKALAHEGRERRFREAEKAGNGQPLDRFRTRLK